jgi:hypothetical protein
LEVIRSSETSILTRATLRHILECGILQILPVYKSIELSLQNSALWESHNVRLVDP